MPHRNEHLLSDSDGDENSGFSRPAVYPQITRAQWAYLRMLTDKNCTDAIDSVAFYSSLSKEAREFLKGADDDKVKLLNSQLQFYANSKVIWKFLLVGGGMLIGGFISVASVLKIFGEYLTVKIK